MTTKAVGRCEPRDYNVVLCLKVQTTQVLDSTLARLIPAVNDIVFPTEKVFTKLKPASNDISYNVTYLAPELRIMRSDDQLLVFVRL
jgi:hypothetical protein